MNSFGVEKGTTIRQPSTANLMVDSADRNIVLNPSAFDFQISKTNSIMNGYFSRIGTTEVVLEWFEPNISDGEIIFDISGATTRSNGTLQIFQTFLTVQSLLETIIADLSGTNGCTFTITQPIGAGSAQINCVGGKFKVVSTPLALQLGLTISPTLGTSVGVSAPDLRLYRYLDFVSPQITYAQDLKDNSTAPFNRDVLCRWYMAEDTPELKDGLGFPILMGYQPFTRRRLYNPPKQIKWDGDLPLGNIQFQLYDEDGLLLPPSEPKTNWLMTLQFSEN